MTLEKIEQEARKRAVQLEESQVLGVYEDERDLYRDDGWNSGEVSGFEDGFIEGAKWVLEKLEKENEQKFDDSNRAWKELVEGWVVDYRGLEEENEQLKEQIEKMKCCLNCKHWNVQHYLCVFSMGDKKYYCRLRQWELAE